MLREAMRRIAESFRPDLVYLFGSRVWGTPSRDSDYDLLVVVRDCEDERRLAGEIRLSLWGLPGAFDIVVRKRSWWDEWSDAPLSMEARIAREGLVIHDAR